MKNSILLITFIALSIIGCKPNNKAPEKTNTDTKTITTHDTIPKSEIKIIPIEHATMVLEYKNVVIYVDPVGGAEKFTEQKSPSLILVTDIHGDHMSAETLAGVTTKNTKIIAPKAVVEQLPDSLKSHISVLANFENEHYKSSSTDINIEAIPMYNLREEALKFHEKGRGNGYVLTMGGKRVYISGDTEDIPEMRSLKDIDMAFVCMNLPYTMTVDSAASAVLDFKPKTVYPYHYRGTNGFSDVEKFKTLVNSKNKSIDIELLNWYTE